MESTLLQFLFLILAAHGAWAIARCGILYHVVLQLRSQFISRTTIQPQETSPPSQLKMEPANTGHTRDKQHLKRVDQEHFNEVDTTASRGMPPFAIQEQRTSLKTRDWIWVPFHTAEYVVLHILIIVEGCLILFMMIGILLEVQAVYSEHGFQSSGRNDEYRISEQITITRDENGVTHIYSADEKDAYYALGWVHARDRLFQLEMHQRAASGTLSEIFGNLTLEADRFLHRAGVPFNAKKHYLALSEHTQSIISAYAAGINEFIDSAIILPFEFYLLGIEPSHWIPENSVGFGQLMSLSFGKSWSDDLKRYELMKVRHISETRVKELWPSYASFLPTILTAANLNTTLPQANNDQLPSNSGNWHVSSRESGATSILQALDQLKILLPYFFGSEKGSNSWVIGGQKTSSGKPFVVNDPHLSYTSPMIWHLSHIKVGDGSRINQVGGYFPGAPAQLVGHNSHGSWGITIGYADISDIYVIDEVNSKKYMYGQDVLFYETREEEIRIRGYPSPEKISIRITLAGPVISDSGFSYITSSDDTSAAADILSLKWSCTEVDRTLDALHGLSHAKSMPNFTAQVAHWNGPGVNLVYGNENGDISYHATGRIPIRAAGHIGDFPIVASPSTEWVSYIPSNKNPRSENPSERILLTANEKVVPYSSNYIYDIQPSNRDYYDGQRSHILRQRAIEVYGWNASQTLGAEEMKKLQLDLISGSYDYYSQMIRRIASSSTSNELQRTWATRLLSWNGTVDTNSRLATVYEAWLLEFMNVGTSEAYDPSTDPQKYWNNKYYLLRLVYNSSDSQYRSTDAACRDGGGDCLSEARAALSNAIETLGGNADLDSIPRYGILHKGVWKHPLFGGTILKDIFGRSASLGGDSYSVNCAGGMTPASWSATYGASYRQIINTADWDDSDYILPLGQSASPFSKWFDNLLTPYIQSKYIKIKRSSYQVVSMVAFTPSP